MQQRYDLQRSGSAIPASLYGGKTAKFFLIMAKSIACSRLKIRAFVLSWEADEAWNRAWAARLPKRCATTKARCEMIIFDEDRPSDSPFVERVWRCHSEGAAPFLSIAASRCELVVSRLQGKVAMTVRGPETRATPLGDCPGDGEWLGILLKLAT